MQKSIPFFAPIAFLAGGAMGYFLLFPSLAQDRESLATKKESPAVKNASELKLVQGKDSNILPLPSGSNINHLLLKYTSFSPQETKRELERLLNERKVSKDYDWALSRATHYLAVKLAYQSQEEAKQLLKAPDVKGSEFLYTALLEGWAQKDFQGAMDYLLAHKNESRVSVRAFKTMTMNLAIQDTDKAQKWASSLTPGERDTALQIMAGAIPKFHPEKTSEFLKTLTPMELASDSLGSTLASQWALSDWDSFKAWTNTLKKNQQETVLSSALKSLSGTDLVKATEVFKKIDKGNNTKMAKSLIEGISNDDRSQGKALDWVMENRESFSDLPYMAGLSVKSYTFTPELKEKVLQLPEGGVRDSALAEMINRRSVMLALMGENDTDLSYTDNLSLAEKIGDSQKREDSIRNCLDQWIYKSPEGARQWITEKSQFSDQDKQKLLQECNQKDRSLRIRM